MTILDFESGTKLDLTGKTDSSKRKNDVAESNYYISSETEAAHLVVGAGVGGESSQVGSNPSEANQGRQDLKIHSKDETKM